MKTNWKTCLATFSNPEAARCIALPDDQVWKLHEQYRRSSPVATTRFITTETVLGTLGFAKMIATGLSPDAVSKPFQHIVREALISLVRRPSSWVFDGPSASESEFHAWLQEGTDHMVRRRAQEILGIHEKEAKRFLVAVDGHPTVTTDNLSEILDRGDSAAMTIVDALALANTMTKRRRDTLFRAEAAKIPA